MSEDTPPRVRTAWSDPDHTRLVYDLEQRMNPRRAVRLRGPDLCDPWATRSDEDTLGDAIFAAGWVLWADRPEHGDCAGWTYDTRDRAYICGCGTVLFVVEPLVPS